MPKDEDDKNTRTEGTTLNMLTGKATAYKWYQFPK